MVHVHTQPVRELRPINLIKRGKLVSIWAAAFTSGQVPKHVWFYSFILLILFSLTPFLSFPSFLTLLIPFSVCHPLARQACIYVGCSWPGHKHVSFYYLTLPYYLSPTSFLFVTVCSPREARLLWLRPSPVARKSLFSSLLFLYSPLSLLFFAGVASSIFFCVYFILFSSC